MATFHSLCPSACLYSLPGYLSLFFKSITTQLLSGAEEWDKNLPDGVDSCNKIYTHDTIVFIGEIVARICRRGSAGKIFSKYGVLDISPS